MTNRTFKTIGFSFLVVLSAAYIGLWIYSSQWFSNEIDRIYKQHETDGVVFLGPKPELKNFPFVPEVHYSGGIKFGNLEVLFPKFIARGYPIPFTSLTLTFPEGVGLNGPVDPKIWNLSNLDITLSIPYRLPAGFYEEDLRAWKAGGGKIHVRDYATHKDHVTARGHGYLALDDNLQPVFDFTSVIKGYDEFINTQKENGMLDPFAAAVGMTILNGLSKTDETTGEKTVTVTIAVRNQMLSVGPIQALPLPLIAWDKRTPPALRQ